MAMLKFRAPPLPIAGGEYKQEYFAQLIRILGLYFNQLDSKTPVQWETVIADEFTGGMFNGNGAEITLPHIAASGNASQYTTTNTPTKVSWDTVESSEFFTLNNDGSATALYGGVYKITYSLQFANSDNSAHDVFVWVEVDGGILVPRSSTNFTLPPRKSVGNPSFLCAYSEVTFPLNAGEKVTLYWATSQAASLSPPADGIYLDNIVASSSPYNRPAAPAAIGSIVFVSALPTPTVTGVYAVGYVGRVTVSTT
jgi:hypothetical protein